MDINTQNSSGMMNGMPPAPQTERKVGPIVGALIIVLVLIVAALYFFGQRLNTESKVQKTAPTEQTSATNSTSASVVTSQPDDVNTLQSDLDNQFNNVDYSF